MLEGQMTDHVKTDLNYVETRVQRSHVQKQSKVMCWQSPGSEHPCLTLELEPFTPCQSSADNQRSFAKLFQASAIQNWCALKNMAGFQ